MQDNPLALGEGRSHLIQRLPESRDRNAHSGDRKCRHRENVSLQILESSPLQHDPAYEWVSGSISPKYCAQAGMPRNGNMNPESRMLGRKKKNDICIA